MDVEEAQPAIPDAVPEEMPSPEPKEEKEVKKKGQRTLNFFNKKDKVCAYDLFDEFSCA